VEADVTWCVKIARALGLEHALLLSSTHREPNAHRRVTSSAFAWCVDHRVTTMHFLAAAIFRHRSRTRRRSVYPYDNTYSNE